MAKEVSAILRLETRDLVPIAVVAIVSLVCIVIFLLPLEVQNSLKVRHSVFDPITYMTASFVHGDLQHLGFNLAFFALFTLMLYIISRKAGKEKLFFWSTLIMFLLLPLLNYSILFYSGIFMKVEFGFGLSLTDSGMIGSTIPFLAFFFKAKLAKFNSMPFVVSMTLLTFSLILVPYSESLILAGVSAACGLAFGALAFPAILRFLREYFGRKDSWLESYLVVLAFISYFCAIASLFPALIVSKGGITDIVSHYIGLLFGIIPFSAIAILAKQDKILNGKARAFNAIRLLRTIMERKL